MFRNYLSLKFNLYAASFDLRQFRTYLQALVDIDCGEIEIACRRANREKVATAVDSIHAAGMRAVLYTGIFGTEDLSRNKQFTQYVQRDINGNPLSDYA